MIRPISHKALSPEKVVSELKILKNPSRSFARRKNLLVNVGFYCFSHPFLYDFSYPPSSHPGKSQKAQTPTNYLQSRTGRHGFKRLFCPNKWASRTFISTLKCVHEDCQFHFLSTPKKGNKLFWTLNRRILPLEWKFFEILFASWQFRWEILLHTKHFGLCPPLQREKTVNGTVEIVISNFRRSKAFFAEAKRSWFAL